MTSRPSCETSLETIIATGQLALRPKRRPDYQSEIRHMRHLARSFAGDREAVLERLAIAALELCNAGSSGISLLETTDSPVFRWVVLAGEYRKYTGGSTPRDFSPCGVCLDRKAPQLFVRPSRYFTYFQPISPEIAEGLVIEVGHDAHQLGTIWIASHNPERHFDREDARIMTSLASFTAILLQSSPDFPRNAINLNPSINVKPYLDPSVFSSWKDIAGFFGRSIRTVQRWEREYGLPVHRPAQHTGVILALRAELAEWLRSSAIAQNHRSL